MINTKIIAIVSGAVLIIVAIGLSMWRIQSNRANNPSPSATTPAQSLVPATTSPIASEPLVSPTILYKRIRAQDIANVPAQYNYSAEIPVNWQVEIVKEAEALNFYDPAAPGATNLDKSQLFIRYFSANSFLTLKTVDILDRQELTIQGRPAVRYMIQKKASVPAFAHQPEWRNEKHVVTDIRANDTNPSIFYVIAQRPGLSNEIYEHFLNSIELP